MAPDNTIMENIQGPDNPGSLPRHMVTDPSDVVMDDSQVAVNSASLPQAANEPRSLRSVASLHSTNSMAANNAERPELPSDAVAVLESVQPKNVQIGDGAAVAELSPRIMPLPEDVQMDGVQYTRAYFLPDGDQPQPQQLPGIPPRPSWLNNMPSFSSLPGGLTLPARPDWLPQGMSWMPRNVELAEDDDIALVHSTFQDPLQGAIALARSVLLPRPEGDGDMHSSQGTRCSSPEGMAAPWDIARYPRWFIDGANMRTFQAPCKMCKRLLYNITKHHVHPNVNRYEPKRVPPQGLTLDDMARLGMAFNQTIPLCRPCHSAIHGIIDNQLMNDSYYKLEQLKSHPRVQAWVAWVRRQPLPSANNAPARNRRRLRTGPKPKKIKIKKHNLEKSKPQKSDRSVRATTLAQRTAAGTALRANGLSKTTEAIGRRHPIPASVSSIEEKNILDALAQMHSMEVGRKFPKPKGSKASRYPWFLNELHQRIGYPVLAGTVIKVMSNVPLYRNWCTWTFRALGEGYEGDNPAENGGASQHDGEDDDADDWADLARDVSKANKRRRRNTSSVSGMFDWKEKQEAKRRKKDDNPDPAGLVESAHTDAAGSASGAANPGAADPSAAGSRAAGSRAAGSRTAGPGQAPDGAAGTVSAKVVIDLTLDSDDEGQQDGDAPGQGAAGAAVEPGFFFDFGGSNTRPGN